mmetsp:Transcript_5775/g.11435  ORF Transcript_5775/g.11435 Transcript_5775/m.11435 type:complete len:100 (-) Transcript_5775:652-951(-)
MLPLALVMGAICVPAAARVSRPLERLAAECKKHKFVVAAVTPVPSLVRKLLPAHANADGGRGHNLPRLLSEHGEGPADAEAYKVRGQDGLPARHEVGNG